MGNAFQHDQVRVFDQAGIDILGAVTLQGEQAVVGIYILDIVPLRLLPVDVQHADERGGIEHKIIVVVKGHREIIKGNLPFFIALSFQVEIEFGRRTAVRRNVDRGGGGLGIVKAEPEHHIARLAVAGVAHLYK
ncbi:hypothetical protein D3C87_1498350 [compost metagenome]